MTDYVDKLLAASNQKEIDQIDLGLRLYHDLNDEIQALARQRGHLFNLINYFADKQGKVVSQTPSGLVVVDQYTSEKGYQMTPEERSELIRDTALQLAQQGYKNLTPSQVQHRLAETRVELGVQQPLPVIGAVLKGMPEFIRRTDGAYILRNDPEMELSQQEE